MAGEQSIDGAFRHILDAISDGVYVTGPISEVSLRRKDGARSLATADDLTAYGRRLVRLIHDSRFAPAEDVGLRVTVSAGGSLVAVDDPDERAALTRADAAMHTAKHRGRDEFATSGNGGGR